MDRRTLLKIGGMGLIGAGLSGCAARSGPGAARGASSATLGRPPLRLAPVRADWDRIIRTTVGLRPHRPSGFRLAADRLDETTVIHNYGHGGSGMSLSWGTGRMAAETALAHDSRRAAVIGCGAVGLTAARQLQRHGFHVTIYALAVPPNTTSNMSMAGFTPTSGLVDRDLRSPAWDAQFREAAEISYRQLQLLPGRGYGVSWIERYELRDDEPRAPGQRAWGRGRRAPAAHAPAHGDDAAGTGRASLSDPLREPEHADTHRAVHLSRRPGPRRGGVRRAHRHPQVHRTEGAGGAGRAARDQLHRARRARPRRRRRGWSPSRASSPCSYPSPKWTTGPSAASPARPRKAVSASTCSPAATASSWEGTSERGEWSTEPNREAMERIVGAHGAVFSAMRT